MQNDEHWKRQFSLFKASPKFLTLIDNLKIPPDPQLSNRDIINIKKTALAILFCVESYLFWVESKQEDISVNENICKQLMKHYFGRFEQDIPVTLDSLIKHIKKSLTSQPEIIHLPGVIFKYSIDMQDSNEKKQISVNIDELLSTLINLTPRLGFAAKEVPGLSCYVIENPTNKMLAFLTRDSQRSQLNVVATKSVAKEKWIANSRSRTAKGKTNFILITNVTQFKSFFVDWSSQLSQFILILLLHIEGHLRNKAITTDMCSMMLVAWGLERTESVKIAVDGLNLLIKENLLCRRTNGTKHLVVEFVKNLKNNNAQVCLPLTEIVKAKIDMTPMIKELVKFEELQELAIRKEFSCYLPPSHNSGKQTFKQSVSNFRQSKWLGKRTSEEILKTSQNKKQCTITTNETDFLKNHVIGLHKKSEDPIPQQSLLPKNNPQNFENQNLSSDWDELFPETEIGTDFTI